ncbi:ABC transporter permease [Tissierella sp.]|uniref:ABC transporter permease n=1 Tax=Tissierella sp. TaxID=41274 RepID=UPI002857DC91|nr:ABC transporter permease [Tissierella sp.]MDR7857741.1 ABC transporter permease [Tissierella sp.]
MLRKIALSSMKGRKKDTIILSSVIILSFLFIAITTILHSSSEVTKYEQKVAMFGEWDFSYYNTDQDIETSLLELDDVDKLGVSRIIGKTANCGVLGTINEELIDIGAFQLHEGRMPEAVDEIALEFSQLKEFPEDIKVGDTIRVRIDFPFIERDRQTVTTGQNDRILAEIEELIEDRIIKVTNIEKIFANNVYQIERNIQSLESYNGTEISSLTSYIYKFLRLNENEEYDPTAYFDDVPRYGGILNRRYSISRNMVITGIIQTYSDLWDRNNNTLPNSFITEETGRKFIEDGYLMSKVIKTGMYKTPYNLFIDTKLKVENFSNKYLDKFENLRINTYLHSDTEDSTEGTLTYSILLGIFIATVISVFLIYLIQIRRRSRRIALLKAIGATNNQIAKLILWEVINLLIIIIPIGIVAGMGLGKVALGIVNKYGKTELNYHIDYILMFLGILVGCIAVLIGILAPMILSMKIPLTGTIAQPPKRKKTLKARLEKIFNKKKINRVRKEADLNIQIQSFTRISLKNIKYNKRKYLMALGLYTITISVLLGSLFSSYLSFAFYRDNIIVTGKPSYGFEVNYGLPQEDIDKYTKELKLIDGVTNVDTYKGGVGAYLWYEGIEQNRLHYIFKFLLPSHLTREHYGRKNSIYKSYNAEYLMDEGVVSNIYGIDVDTEIYRKFEKAITKGSLDKDRFEAGKEVLILSPIYNRIVENSNKGNSNKDNSNKDNNDETILMDTKQSNRMKILLKHNKLYDISYDFRKSEGYSQDNSIGIADTIYITIPYESIGESISSKYVESFDLKVGAIIHYFPEEGIWPFSETIENPVVVGSYKLIERLYPSTIKSRYAKSKISMLDLIQWRMPTMYGKSWVFIETDKSSFKTESLTIMNEMAKEGGFKLHEYKEGNDFALKTALNSATIPLMLGLVVALINIIILYNTSKSKLEQERDRIGILQALGVTKEEFKKLYLILGALYGLISLIVFHMALAFTISFTSIGKSAFISMSLGKYINYILSKAIWLYPWPIHIIICIIFFATTTLTYYLPLRKIIDNQAIENIRSLVR